MVQQLPHPPDAQIAVIGLGYVGLPLAVAFGQRQAAIGYDIDARRIQRLQAGSDPTREVSGDQLESASQLQFTANPESLSECQVYIVAVPTPVDAHKRPDLSHLEHACQTIAPHLQPGNIVIFEATVYPGCTEEVCIPILEANSGLTAAFQSASGSQTATHHGAVPSVVPAEAKRRAGTSHATDQHGSTHSPNSGSGFQAATPPNAGGSGFQAAKETGQGEPNPTSEQFHVGYSPERINPGDSAHSLRNVVKITAGSNPEAATFVDELYKSVVNAGTHPVSSIAVAEAAKVIENTQRDLNIALVNELALIFNRLGLDSKEVLDAAGTKWNFLPFRPGLVGGHCIGVDPYYLTYKAEAVGYHPQVILAGRRINDGMGRYVAGELVKLMIRRGITMRDARVLVLGLAFKENCADIRNTRVVDIIEELKSYQLAVDVHDPWVSSDDAMPELGIETIDQPAHTEYDGVVIAVGHEQFREHGIDAIRRYARSNGVVYDVKSIFARPGVDARL